MVTVKDHEIKEKKATEEYYILRCYAVFAGVISLMFRSKMLPPSSLCYLHTSYLAYSSTLKMEAICSPETHVNFYKRPRYYIPEDKYSSCSVM
jgi:hypothetical protein